MKFIGSNFEYRLNFIKRKRETGDNAMRTLNVFVGNDEPISAICFVNTAKKCSGIAIESGNWLKQNVLKSEVPRYSNNRIYSGKGASALSSPGGRIPFKVWKENTVYNKDDVVCLSAVMKRWSSGTIDEFKFWAMCMNKHTSNKSNKPQKNEIFTDLTLNHSAFIKVCLIEYVHGFNDELSAIIISYCYKTNDFWWNGCGRSKYNDYCNCGDLIMGIQSTEYCKLCMIEKNEKNKSKKVKFCAENMKSGAVIYLNKNDGNVIRTHLKNDDDEKQLTEDIMLRTSIESETEKKKIFNLFARNFNESMAPLISACIYNQTSFVYKHDGKEIEVNIGDANVWCLYDANEQLLCSLIWRFVHIDGPQRETLLFEVLFLSTFENVRFNHYGQRMVKHIELYCIQNQYDIMAVAAVPVHGEAFWKSNGFELRHNAPTSDKEKMKDKKMAFEMLRHHMLVFDDTPLFAKRVRKN